MRMLLAPRFSRLLSRTALATLLPALLTVSLLAGCASAPQSAAGSVQVKLLAINDFHGQLRPPQGGIRVRDPADAARTVNLPAGGAEHLATAVNTLRAQNPNHIFVAAGDLVGATPLLSALFRDEPTIESLSGMGLEVAAVGNHEFDKGAGELLRLQNGGCHAEGCLGPQPYAGARFQYLAASTVVQATGRTLLPAYHVKRFEGVPVAFIGLTLAATPSIVVPTGVAGLSFREEAETVNALVPKLREQGIEAIVLLIHEGGLPSGDYNECPGISGPIVGIVGRLDKAVDVVVSGHTHRAYNCRIDGRLVTSGDRYGTVVTQIDLTLDRRSGDVVNAVADNVIVRPERFAKDPWQTALIEAYEARARPLARRVVGRIGATLPREPNAAGETAIGQVIADSQLAATAGAGAQIALMNPGGIRAALTRPDDGLLRVEDLYTVQPFANNLVTLTLTGAQLLQVLEQQWLGQPMPRILQVSRGFSYEWDASRAPGQRVLPGSLRLDGQPLDMGRGYRVTVNSFLAAGGDNFSVFTSGREATTGMMDIDALEQYMKSHPELRPGPLERIGRAP